MISSVDVAVIGAGLAGLTAAAYLARAGKQVVIFEQSKQVGGRACTQTKRSFALNLGAHALYQDSVGARILAELGVQYSGSTPSQRGLFMQYQDELHRMPSGPISLLTSRFLSGAKLEAAWRFSTLPRQAPPPDMSATQWLAQIRAGSLRHLFAGMLRLVSYSANLDALSARAALPYLRLAMQGKVLYLDRGWQTLVDGLRSAAESADARIETGARVETVSSRARGGTTELRLAQGRTVAAAAVIIAASPEDAAALVDRGENPALRAWAQQAEPAHAACLDVALRALPHPERNFLLGLDRPVYASVHAPPADLAPPGAALVHALKYNTAAETDPASDRAGLEAVRDGFQPGWRDRAEIVRFLPRMTVNNALPCAQHGGIPGRPGPEVPDAPGVYVAGDWVGTDGMLADAALAAAHTAAEHALAFAAKR
jgi:phytoene dehydrogenase-like protein